MGMIKKIVRCPTEKYKFVLHEHYATHHHYDFRLEKYGTLKSWALPKGMPAYVGDKHLAIQMPNHPLSYLYFEGNIAEGKYGAGKVLIADIGCYEPVVWEQNKIEVILEGKKYRGKYILIHTSGQNWLLIRGKK